MLSISPESNFSPSKRNELENLKSNIEKCINLNVCVAFFTDWRKDCNEINLLLIDKLKKDSFIIVDPTSPTNHEYCDFLAQSSCNVYFAEKAMKLNKDEAIKLMHTKIYVFDFGKEVEIWIGSMNFTKAGITGENFECSTKIICSKTDNKYLATMEYLEYIKKTLCKPWPLNGKAKSLISLYQSQKPNFNRFLGDLKTTIFLVTEDIRKLDFNLNSFINIFFTQKKVTDLKKGKEIILCIYDKYSSKQFTALSRLTQIADIEFGKTDIVFNDARAFAVYLDSKLLFLEEKGKFNYIIHSNQLKSFLTLEIIESLNESKEMYFPLEYKDFYTDPFDIESIFKTNFGDILKKKELDTIKIDKLFGEEIFMTNKINIFKNIEINLSGIEKESVLHQINKNLSFFSSKRKKVQLTTEVLIEANKFLVHEI